MRQSFHKLVWPGLVTTLGTIIIIVIIIIVKMPIVIIIIIITISVTIDINSHNHRCHYQLHYNPYFAGSKHFLCFYFVTHILQFNPLES